MRKTHVFMISALLIVVGLTSHAFFFDSIRASSLQQITIPDQAELEHYIWEVPEAVNVDPYQTLDLVQELNAEIEAFMDEGRHAPWMMGNGRGGSIIYFLEPPQTLYSLALAYPYLSQGLQTRVRTFAAQEQATYHLLWNRYTWDDGLSYSNGVVTADTARRRETGVPGPYNFCGVINNCEEVWWSYAFQKLRRSFDRLYDIWFYAYRTDDWSFVESRWNNIVDSRSIIADVHNDEDLLGMPLDANESGSDDSANRRVAALIAYTRMAYHMGDTDEVAWGVDAATRAMQARLRYTDSNRPTPWDGTTDDPDVGTWEHNNASFRSANGGVFIVRRGTHFTNIPEYTELTPEIGQLLHDYAATEFAQYDQFIDIAKPAAYMQMGGNSFGGSNGGEVPNVFPHNVQGIFLAKALVMNLPGDTLSKYADVAWVKQDLFYWERLARTIDAYGTTCLEDPRTPAIECPMSMPPTLSATKTASTEASQTGDTFTYTITLIGSGVPVTVTDAIPLGTEYNPGSVDGGWFNAGLNQVEYTDGTLDIGQVHSVTFGVTTVETRTIAIINTATVTMGSYEPLYPSVTVIANSRSVFLPVVLKGYH
ncbi:MAG: hypothetical protein SXV54_07530 [Chloroflexota bacterium]|nr:hypothetical protein [Chloroflexota bacterium]